MGVIPLGSNGRVNFLVRFSVKLYSKDYERFKSLAVKVIESEIWSVLVGDFWVFHLRRWNAEYEDYENVEISDPNDENKVLNALRKELEEPMKLKFSRCDDTELEVKEVGKTIYLTYKCTYTYYDGDVYIILDPKTTNDDLIREMMKLADNAVEEDDD
jgi:hypothetical protein